MEQRPLRVGDLVDDYCPRERRITNHAIVATVEDRIRQTRCMTCDAEHAYKHAKPPRVRKKEPAEALYDQVLAGVSGGQLVTPRSASAPGQAVDDDQAPAAGEPEGVTDLAASASGEDEPPVHDESADRWMAHRPLIRATLPRTEGDQPVPRPIPEFTMHQRNVRGSHMFRQHGFGRPDQGEGGGRNGSRFGQSGQGHGQERGPGQGHGRSKAGGRHNRHHGKQKRSK
jgi:hypothetical protein